MSAPYIAIHNKTIIARGNLESIIQQCKALSDTIEPMVFEMESCKRIEFSWFGTADVVIKQAKALLEPDLESQATKRGRPKLGVKSKEVTLLPRHWEWLATQRGGASVTLRRLVDHAIKNAPAEDLIKVKQNQLHQLMSVFADAEGFEEATRALYRNSKVSLLDAMKTWPDDFQNLVLEKFEAINLMHQGEALE